MLDAAALRQDFPILRDGRLTYLDSAATAQKPEAVLHLMDQFYRTQYGSIHRGVHELSEASTNAYESARKHVASFLGGHVDEVVFTRGTTEGINLVAAGWGRDNLGKGDVIVLTEMEHHANLVPWYILAERSGCEVRFISLTDDGLLDLDDAAAKLKGAKLLSFTHVSNVLGTINPVRQLTEMAHEAGACVLLDAAQSVPNMPVSVRDLGVDWLAFSGHKALGPTGIGVLWGTQDRLAEMPPVFGGGQMIKEVKYGSFEPADPPYRFEAGTMPAAEVVGLSEALVYLDRLGLENIRNHERHIVYYALKHLAEIPKLKILGPTDSEQRGGLVSFVIDGVHAHDAATILSQHDVAVRSGHHCAQPLHDKLGIPASIRASFSVYNDTEDVDQLVAALKQAIKVLA